MTAPDKTRIQELETRVNLLVSILSGLCKLSWGNDTTGALDALNKTPLTGN